jgi:integrase
MVRSPRFEPGSSAWQADVLDQTRLRPHGTSVTDAKIANTLINLKTNGSTSEKVIKRIGTALSRIAEKANLDNPQEVKLFIADLRVKDKKGEEKNADNQTKNKYASAYNHYCVANKIEWKKPYYKVVEKTPLIPTPQDVQAIIDNCSEDYVTIFTIEAEIGCCPEELYQVTRGDVNTETGSISIKGVKGHASKNYKLKPQTKELLLRFLARHQKEHPFPKAHTQSQMFLQFKTKAYEKLHRPEIMKIQLRNLRNYSGERFYKSLPIRDPIMLMQHFRHKKLERTMHYVRAIFLDYEEDENWISLITNSPEEECRAVEKGYQLVRGISETKAIYRKRKAT